MGVDEGQLGGAEFLPDVSEHRLGTGGTSDWGKVIIKLLALEFRAMLGLLCGSSAPRL
jgi:hypothetical protein